MTSLRDDPSNPRWLRKALRELPREIARLVERFDDHALRAKPDPDQWSALEVLGWLAAAEHEDLRTVEVMIEQDGAAIEDSHAYLAPLERDFSEHSAYRLLEDFLDERESLLWSLEFVTREWDNVGQHPYRGDIPLRKFLREISDRDMEASIMLRRLLDAAGPEAVGVRRRRSHP